MVIRSTLIPSPKETTKTISCDKKESRYIVEILLRKKQKNRLSNIYSFPKGALLVFVILLGVGVAVKMVVGVYFTRPLGRKG